MDMMMMNKVVRSQKKNSKPKHHMNVVLNIIIELWKSTRINPDILFSMNLDDCP